MAGHLDGRMIRYLDRWMEGWVDVLGEMGEGMNREMGEC